MQLDDFIKTAKPYEKHKKEIVTEKQSLFSRDNSIKVDPAKLDEVIKHIESVPEYALDKSRLRSLIRTPKNNKVIYFNSGYILSSKTDNNTQYRVQHNTAGKETYIAAKDLVIIAFGKETDAILLTKYFGKHEYKAASTLKDYRATVKTNHTHRGYNFVIVSHLQKCREIPACIKF